VIFLKPRNNRTILSYSVFLLAAASGLCQTYQLDPGGKTQAPSKDTTESVTQELGWGSNIQNARLARTAEIALQRGDYALAFTYAQKAAEAAPSDPQLWYLLGYAARLNGRLSNSIEAYQRGLRLKPSLDGTSGLAQSYLAAGRVAEAERLLRQVVASSPQRRNELLMFGDLSMRKGDYEDALGWLERAERISPAAQSELLMAVAYQHLQKMEEASRYLSLARTHAPNNPDVQRAFAAFYRDSGDYNKAIDALAGIHNPKPDVIAELAFTYALAGRFEEAARSYAKAADLLPKDLNLQLSAAQAYVTITSFDRAEKFLERATKLSPNYYRLHAIRASIAQIQDQNEVAIGEYKTAIENLPANPIEGPLYGIQLHMSLIPLYRSSDEREQANGQLAITQGLLAAVSEQSVDRATFYRLRATVHYEADENDAALSDIEKSLALKPSDVNSLQLNGDVLMKLGRTAEAVGVFQNVLKMDPHSRFALTSLGYAARGAKNYTEAERYFGMLAKEYPNSYVPYLALGDMYTEIGDYKKADEAYQRGHRLAPTNSLIIAGGMNASIEAHDLPLAGRWKQRVTPKMLEVPQVLREEERYFSFDGNAEQAAAMGRRAIRMIPNDREVVVYLGYALLHLEQFEELKRLTGAYMTIFPRDADIPLLAGYVAKHDRDFMEAVNDFTEAIRRDPRVATAYTNRGFLYNDLGRPTNAAEDFKTAIRLAPNAEAYMGLAFAELRLGHPRQALQATDRAEALAGNSKLIHTVRATAFGRLGMLSRATVEYRAALKLDPEDGALYLGLANIFFGQHRYNDALIELEAAQKHAPANAEIYALVARSNAELGNEEAARRNVELAEGYADKPPAAEEHLDATEWNDRRSAIYVSTGEAFSVLGKQQEAMARFTQALGLRPTDRVSVRLAIAADMARRGQTTDVQRQIALAQMEADAGDATSFSGDQYIAAAGALQQVHEYELSEVFLEKAKAAGAPDPAVRISLANSYLALGQTRLAAAELAAVRQSNDSELDYQYLLTQSVLFQQEHRNVEMLSSIAAASSDSGADSGVERRLIEAGGMEGYRVNQRLSVLSNLTVQPIFEDGTVYVLDSKLNSPSGPVAESDITRLPPPRSSIESNLTAAYNIHTTALPTVSGYFQVRNALGTISIPATASVVDRNTTDYALNVAVNPAVHVGSNIVTFNSGVQGTLRRDTRSPIEMDQNLFRIFTYASTSSFLNAVTADGFISAEFGGFTNLPITERQVSGAIGFRVGRPWGRNALVTGWRFTNQEFFSTQLGDRQNFYTSSYIGLNSRVSQRFSAEALVEDLRAWRSLPFSPIVTSISQGLRPGGSIRYAASDHWQMQASSSFESIRGFHTYDMWQNGVTVSYMRALDHSFNEATGERRLKYPIRFSAGIQEQHFPNFNYGNNMKIVPVFSLSIF